MLDGASVIYDRLFELPTRYTCLVSLILPLYLERPRYDEHLCALHAGNYRLRPKVIEVNKWLFLSPLKSYSSILSYHHRHCAD
jgi:hypothetical protein